MLPVVGSTGVFVCTIGRWQVRRSLAETNIIPSRMVRVQCAESRDRVALIQGGMMKGVRNKGGRVWKKAQPV